MPSDRLAPGSPAQPAPDPADAGELWVDVTALRAAAYTLDQLPAPADPGAARPPAAAVGDRATAAALTAYYDHYRATTTAMAADNDAAAAHLRASADTYHDTDTPMPDPT